jgi:hypothetical protein
LRVGRVTTWADILLVQVPDPLSNAKRSAAITSTSQSSDTSTSHVESLFKVFEYLRSARVDADPAISKMLQN